MASSTFPEASTRLPGTRSSCALLTVSTVLMAWPNQPALLGVLVRTAYFALLTWFFWRTTRTSPALQSPSMRLVRSGFLVLTLGFATSASIQLAGIQGDHPAFRYLCEVCERGAMFLLGTTLVSYGLMLWLPQVLQSHSLLGEHYAQQSGRLQQAETAKSQLEHRLVEADRRGMLGELAASIAHDLRNPLTIVKGTAESMCRRARSREEIAEHTAVIRRNIDKADQTIQALIDLARPRRHVEHDVPVHEVLAEVQGLLQVEARRRRTELESHAGDGSLRLATDRTLLTQALLNLALNAVQAGRGDADRVLLRARAVGRRHGACVLFVVEDRGQGLPAEVQRERFTPFFTTKANGTGLGLPSCRRIANELGGTLRLYPRQRGGTRAVLALPREPDSAAPGANADETAAWVATSC